MNSKKVHRKIPGPIDAYTISFSSGNYPTIQSVTEIAIRGPWKTKSDAELSVLFAFPYRVVKNLFSYDKSELGRLSKDIRGLRSYTVKNIQTGKEGGGEFHRIRTEFLFAYRGLIQLTCEDLQGTISTYILDQKKGVLIPPFIMHSYKALSEADLLVVANTLFFADDPETFDTYGPSLFGNEAAVN